MELANIPSNMDMRERDKRSFDYGCLIASGYYMSGEMDIDRYTRIVMVLAAMYDQPTQVIA